MAAERMTYTHVSCEVPVLGFTHIPSWRLYKSVALGKEPVPYVHASHVSPANVSIPRLTRDGLARIMTQRSEQMARAPSANMNHKTRASFASR